MRNSPVVTVDPNEISAPERKRVAEAVTRAKECAVLDLAVLPAAVRAQVLFALDSLAHGHQVAAVATGKALTTSEAAEPPSGCRAPISAVCVTRVGAPTYAVGTSRRIQTETVMTILGNAAASVRRAVRRGTGTSGAAAAARAAGSDE